MKKLIFTILSIVIIFLVLISGFVYSAIRDTKALGTPESIKSAENTTSLFLENVNKGNFQAAYNLTSSKLKEKVTFQDLEIGMVGYQGNIIKQKITTAKIEKRLGEGVFLEYQGIIIFTNDRQTTFTAELLYENNMWRIQSLDIPPYLNE